MKSIEVGTGDDRTGAYCKRRILSSPKSRTLQKRIYYRVNEYWRFDRSFFSRKILQVGKRELKTFMTDNSDFIKKLYEVLKCFISYQIFKYPVLGTDGTTYSCSDIEWWSNRNIISSIRRRIINLKPFKNNTLAKSFVDLLQECIVQKLLGDAYKMHHKRPCTKYEAIEM